MPENALRAVLGAERFTALARELGVRAGGPVPPVHTNPPANACRSHFGMRAREPTVEALLGHSHAAALRFSKDGSAAVELSTAPRLNFGLLPPAARPPRIRGPRLCLPSRGAMADYNIPGIPVIQPCPGPALRGRSAARRHGALHARGAVHGQHEALTSACQRLRSRWRRVRDTPRGRLRRRRRGRCGPLPGEEVEGREGPAAV
ncbi:unnamed protein product, partial [Prorocentrum cordatum]